MRRFSDDFAAHIAQGATTLCWCWRVTRKDSVRMGFTDHDRALVFDGVSFEPLSGFSGTEIESSLGLAVDNLDVEGALSSDAITEGDIAAGLYDDAEIVLFRVNWQDVSQREILKRGSIGEVSRGELAFQAEFRSLAHRLQQTVGRTYQFGCDAVLGDARCGVNLEDPAFKGTGAATSVSERVVQVSGLDGFADDHFSQGRLTWQTGENEGQTVKVKAHQNDGAMVEITLWQRPVNPIAAGDTFTVLAGCPHTFEACQAKFDNAVNFRGFPHIPGNDFVLGYARQNEEDNDGSPIVR
ncbi:MAG: DUF2163 domain-containing protein [Roseibium sp.]|nr:DUF2163 domain-containing protein [Roseibium sp.]